MGTSRSPSKHMGQADLLPERGDRCLGQMISIDDTESIGIASSYLAAGFVIVVEH